MAIISLHEAMTRDVLAEFGFSKGAAGKAAAANAAVDRKQGNIPEETHLHAMVGVVAGAGGKLVPEKKDQAIAAIQALIDGARKEIVTTVLGIPALKDTRTQGAHATSAVSRIGETLHTVQDREFHGFEVWPHNGICSALIADPIGLGLHGIHDTGSLYAEAVAGANPSGRQGVELNLGYALVPEHNVFLDGRVSYVAGGGQPADRTAMVGICLGACGSTRPTREAYTSPGLIDMNTPTAGTLALKGLTVTGAASSGPVNNVRNRAVEASRRFLRAVKMQVEATSRPAWQQFVNHPSLRN